MPAPICKCEVEIDPVRQEGRFFLCPLHTSAPDLYEALEWALRIMLKKGNYDFRLGVKAKDLAAAYGALAKARGEQPEPKEVTAPPTSTCPCKNLACQLAGFHIATCQEARGEQLEPTTDQGDTNAR